MKSTSTTTPAHDPAALAAATPPGTSVLAVPEEQPRIVPWAMSSQTLFDAMTGEALPESLAELFAGETAIAGWKTVSVNGFVSPLRGNQVIGLLRAVGEIESNYGAKMRTIYTIEGAASQYTGEDAALLTKAKQDPTYDPEKWATTVGNFIVGEMSAMKGLAAYKDRWVRLAFGEYAKGSRTPKRMLISLAPPNDPRIRELAKALSITI